MQAVMLRSASFRLVCSLCLCACGIASCVLYRGCAFCAEETGWHHVTAHAVSGRRDGIVILRLLCWGDGMASLHCALRLLRSLCREDGIASFVGALGDFFQ